MNAIERRHQENLIRLAVLEAEVRDLRKFMWLILAASLGQYALFFVRP